MNEYQMTMLWWEATVRSFFAQRRPRTETGASVTETVIITALFAAGAIAIGAIIIKKFTDKANTIPTE